MVKLDKIYTRGGDKGETHLGDGSRAPKHSLRFAAIGTVDETNSAIGIARLETEGDDDAMLARIQNDLFDLGADLSAPEDGRKAEARLRTRPSQSGTVNTCNSPFSSQRRSAEGWKIAPSLSASPSYRPSK